MDNEEMLLNFMEVSNLGIEDARRRLEEAGFNLELAIQQYYDSQQETEEVQQNIPEDEEVRPVIPRAYDIMIPEEDTRRTMQLCRVGRQFVSSFRDLKREMEIQEELARGQKPKKMCLEDIYRNPIDITSNLDFNYAKLHGSKIGKWVAVLINNENFESLSFNRDFFNEPSQKAKNILKKNFIFIRKNSNDIEGMTIMGLYNLTDSQVPIFLVIDSLTGELKKSFTECNKTPMKNIIKELKKYTAGNDKELLYNSSYEDSDDEIEIAPSICYASTSSTSLKIKSLDAPTTSQSKPPQKVTKYESDEESFASISTNDGDFPNDDDDNKTEEPKVLDSDDELLKNDDGSQTNVLLKLQDENHKFKYPSKRTVGQLINYIYRNYLLPTGIYDNKTKRFSLFSKIHNSCLTSLDNEKNLEDAKIHPSIVLMHNTLEKD